MNTVPPPYYVTAPTPIAAYTDLWRLRRLRIESAYFLYRERTPRADPWACRLRAALFVDRHTW